MCNVRMEENLTRERLMKRETSPFRPLLLQKRRHLKDGMSHNHGVRPPCKALSSCNAIG